jgi:hypothetical protein
MAFCGVVNQYKMTHDQFMQSAGPENGPSGCIPLELKDKLGSSVNTKEYLSG